MFRLMMVIHAVVMTALMGICVTAVLTMNLPGWKPVALAALVGFVASIPASWLIARAILRHTGGQEL